MLNITNFKMNTPRANLSKLINNFNKNDNSKELILAEVNTIGINTINCDGDTPLALAIKRNNFDIVKFLVEAGADVNFDGHYMYPPLIQAIESRANYDIVKFLIENGADTNIQYEYENADGNEYEWSLLTIAISRRCESRILRYLIDLDFKLDSNVPSDFIFHIIDSYDEKYADITYKLLDMIPLTQIDVNVIIDDSYSYYYMWTPLLYIIEFSKEDINIIKKLLDLGANVNFKRTLEIYEDYDNDREITPLLLAAKQGYTKIMHLLIEYGANINHVDYYGSTSLMWTSSSPNFEATKLLIEAGANINDQDKSGWSALMVAIDNRESRYGPETSDRWNTGNYDTHGNDDVINFLLDSGANIYLENRSNKTAIILAVENNRKELIYRLIEMGVNVENILNYIKRCAPFDLMKNLLELGASVNDADGNSPILLKCLTFQTNYDIINLLLDAGANINSKTNHGETVLDRAICADISIVRLMIEHGIDIDAQTNLGRTALMTAVQLGKYETVELLLNAGASVNIRDNHNKTALTHIKAVFLNKNEITELLISYGAIE